MSRISDGSGENEDQNWKMSSWQQHSDSSQQEEEAGEGFCKRRRGMNSGPGLFLKNESGCGSERTQAASFYPLGSLKAPRFANDGGLKDMNVIGEEVAAGVGAGAGAGANAGLIAGASASQSRLVSFSVHGTGLEKSKGVSSTLHVNVGGIDYHAGTGNVEPVQDVCNSGMAGYKKVASEFFFGKSGSQDFRSAEAGLSSGSGTRNCENSASSYFKLRLNAGLTSAATAEPVTGPVESAGRGELQVLLDQDRRFHHSQIGSTCMGSTSKVTEGEPNAGEKTNACSALDEEHRQVGCLQSISGVANPRQDAVFSTMELDEARRDMVAQAQAHDRWTAFGARQDFQLLAVANDVRPFQHLQGTLVLDASLADVPEAPVSSKPESLPLLPGASENGIDPPGNSFSQSEERNVIDSASVRPVKRFTDTSCTEADVIAVSSSNMNFDQGKANAIRFPGSAVTDSKSETQYSVGPATFGGPLESGSNTSLQVVAKLSEEAVRAFPQHIFTGYNSISTPVEVTAGETSCAMINPRGAHSLRTDTELHGKEMLLNGVSNMRRIAVRCRSDEGSSAVKPWAGKVSPLAGSARAEDSCNPQSLCTENEQPLKIFSGQQINEEQGKVLRNVIDTASILELQQVPDVEGAAQDNDQVTQVGCSRKADQCGRRVSRGEGSVSNIWISHFSVKGLPGTSKFKQSDPCLHDVHILSEQGSQLGNEAKDEAGNDREQGCQLGLISLKETEPLVLKSAGKEQLCPANSGVSTYVISRRIESDAGKLLSAKMGKTSVQEIFSERLLDSHALYSDYLRHGSLHTCENGSDGELNGQDLVDFTTAMASVKDWRIVSAKYWNEISEKEDQNVISSNCTFCGLRGHAIHQCSETRDCELCDLQRQETILDRLRTNTDDIYCLRCLGKGHWGAECSLSVLEASTKEELKLQKEKYGHSCECMGERESDAFLNNSISSHGRNSGIAEKSKDDHHQSEMQASRCLKCGGHKGRFSEEVWPCCPSREAYVRSKVGEVNHHQGSRNLFANLNDRNSYAQHLVHRSLDVKRRDRKLLTEFHTGKSKGAGRRVVNRTDRRPSGSLTFTDDQISKDYYSALAIPNAEAQRKLNGGIPLIPKGMLVIVESIRLSRADLFKWVSHTDFSSYVKGFFLRLRFGKWEEELGGTGYRMACIKGASQNFSVGNKKVSVLVDLGDMECTVDSQYVSNRAFTEAELVEWWRATGLSGQCIPKESELKAKLKERQAWSF